MASVASAGAILIKKIGIINNKNEFIDMSKAFVSLKIYESIMSPFISGSVLVSDSISMSSLLPLIGEETIRIEFETPGHDGAQFKYTKLFYLYKMNKNTNASMKNAYIELMFISVDGFVDMNTRISQTYKGSIDNSVQQILTQDIGLGTKVPLNIEKTTNRHTHTSNFWSPAQNIFYLTKNALNLDGNPNFLFFENREGFNFISLDTLYKQQVTMEFIRDQKFRSANPDGETLPDPMGDYARIVDMDTADFYDYIDRLQCGMYGATLYHYDVETKRLRHIVKDSRVDYAHNMLNEVNAMTSSAVSTPSAKMMVDIINRSLYNNSTVQQVDNDIKRMALLKSAEAFKTNIRVFGRASYKVGDVYNLKIYANKSIDASVADDKLLDPVLSGKYLASAVVHDIDREAHYCNIELIRDSYGK